MRSNTVIADFAGPSSPARRSTSSTSARTAGTRKGHLPMRVVLSDPACPLSDALKIICHVAPPRSKTATVPCRPPADRSMPHGETSVTATPPYPRVGAYARRLKVVCGYGVEGTHTHDRAGMNRDATPPPPRCARGVVPPGGGVPPHPSREWPTSAAPCPAAREQGGDTASHSPVPGGVAPVR